jgi:hypothetical protein
MAGMSLAVMRFFLAAYHSGVSGIGPGIGSVIVAFAFIARPSQVYA